MPASACPSHEELQALLEGRAGAEREADLADHLGGCAACRAALDSIAAGACPAELWVRKLREERVELGPAMRGVLSTMGTHGPALEPRSAQAVAGDEPSLLDPPDGPDCIGRLGRYRVLKRVGRGGMGVVFQARDPLLGRLVAIKVLTPHLGGDATARERFLREARAAAAINHPNVVTIYEIQEIAGRLLLVMEFVDGVSLQERLAGRVPFSLPEIVRIGVQAATGLAAAHARGLVHRDVKPANILLARPGDQVKITDFGLARATDDAGVTQLGVILGTPAYMAPEQALGQAVDHRADLFSLGSVLYALCTGRPPYAGSTTLAVIRLVADGSPLSLGASAPAIPPWLAEVVSRLHSLNPADRIQSAAEVAQLLRRKWETARRSGAAAAADLLPEKAAPAVTGEAPAAATVSAGAAAPSLVMPPPLPSHEVKPPPRPPAPAPPPAIRPPPRASRVASSWLRAAIVLAVLLSLAPLAMFALKHRSQAVPPKAAAPAANRDEQRPPPGKAAIAAAVPIAIGAAAVPSGPPPRFALIGRSGAVRRSFSEFPGAIQEAAAGDTLEIRGSDAVRIAPLHLEKPLVLRAAHGARPALCPALTTESGDAPLIESGAALVIEGLDIQCLAAGPRGYSPQSVLAVRHASLRLANCRVIHCGAGPALRLEDPTLGELRNSLLCSSTGAAVDCVAGGRVRVLVENCVLAGYSGITVHQTARATDVFLELRHDTMVLHEAVRVHFDPVAREQAKGDGRVFIHVAVTRSLFDTDGALLTNQSDRHSPAEVERIGRFSRGEAGRNVDHGRGKSPIARANAGLANIKKAIAWQDEQSLYSGTGPLLAMASSQSPRQLSGLGVPAGIAQWDEFWGASKPEIAQLSDGSFDARTLRSAATAHPQLLTPGDFRRTFRLRGAWRPLESRLEGVNTSLVGPGEAYEAWKNTFEYRNWLDTIRGSALGR
jgi:hypothetical protein